MSAQEVISATEPTLPGSPLRPSDLEQLARAGINADLAERALLRRVDSETGGLIVGRNGSGDYAGIAIPYIWPGTNRVREYRLRRDTPEMEWSHGVCKPRGKYPYRESCIPILTPASTPLILHKSRMRRRARTDPSGGAQ
ncbi:MAG: hypothetical protein QOJ42_8031 [Acidobacteriaceae bacterium]|jgi:hypothetical protein|nr:hypothetical protein [Acidobacteriaceae bacterium]